LKAGNLNLLEPSGPVQAFTGIVLPLYESINKGQLMEVMKEFGIPSN
jgi:hypothetical protein